MEKKIDDYKRYMLIFDNENFEHEIFFFDTKESMFKFAKQDNIRVEKMFYLVDVEE